MPAPQPPPPPPGTADDRKAHARRVLRRLRADYADAECALRFETPEQLLIATILSAQCTDERVNLVTAKLFADCPAPADIAALPIKRLEKYLQSIGLYRNKAKNVRACCETLVAEHGGRVPQNLDQLVPLAGVGRKTANVVLGVAFGKPEGVVVDTHVGRLSRRLGLTTETDAVKVEHELSALLPKTRWVEFPLQMIEHGRAVCDARRPNCDACSMRRFCPRVGVNPPASPKQTRPPRKAATRRAR